jgi:hypothetical protein
LTHLGASDVIYLILLSNMRSRERAWRDLQLVPQTRVTPACAQSVIGRVADRNDGRHILSLGNSTTNGAVGKK